MKRRLAFSLSGLALAYGVLIGCGDVSHPVTTNGSTTLGANNQDINAARSIRFLVDGNTNTKDLKSFIAAQVQNSSNPQIEYEIREIDPKYANVNDPNAVPPNDAQGHATYFTPLLPNGLTLTDALDPANSSNAATIYYTTAADIYADPNFPNKGNLPITNYPEAQLYRSVYSDPQKTPGYSNAHLNTTDADPNTYRGYGFERPSAFGDFNPRTVAYTPPTKVLDDPKMPGKPLDTFLLYVIPQDPAFAPFGIRIHLDLNVALVPPVPTTITANTTLAPTLYTAQFQASVPGDGLNHGVTWKVERTDQGVPATVEATISPTGLFTAPHWSDQNPISNPATYKITATSVTQPDKFTTTNITVAPASTNISFRAATVRPSRVH